MAPSEEQLLGAAPGSSGSRVARGATHSGMTRRTPAPSGRGHFPVRSLFGLLRLHAKSALVHHESQPRSEPQPALRTPHVLPHVPPVDRRQELVHARWSAWHPRTRGPCPPPSRRPASAPAEPTALRTRQFLKHDCLPNRQFVPRSREPLQTEGPKPGAQTPQVSTLVGVLSTHLRARKCVARGRQAEDRDVKEASSALSLPAHGGGTTLGP